jgi:aspartyl-tRNA(Asn)/glutamyl-tRNA(Gln) amidotransferase subunit A
VCSTLNEGLAALFEEVDVLITPALPTVAFNAEGPMPSGAGGERFTSGWHAVGAMYPFNFSGHPAAVLRCPGAPTVEEALPPGSIQVVAERHRDDLVLQVSAIFEASTAPLDWPEVDVGYTPAAAARL